MQVLLVHPNTFTEYHLERLIKKSFEDLGHTVVALKYRGEPEEWVSNQLKQLSADCDFAIVLKGETLTQNNYDSIQCLSTYWYVDHPKDNQLPEWLVLGASNVDYVFASSYGLLESLREYNQHCYWLVEGAHLSLLQPVEKEEQYDLSFFGTLIAETNNGDIFGSRALWLKRINEKYGVHLFGVDSDREVEGYRFENHYPAVWNESLAEKIAETKIVLGYNSTNKIELYWSNRTYTTLACKGFLITPYVPGLERVFENHKELVWYHSEEELDRYIEYYLVRPVQRRQIAEAGYQKVVATLSTKQQIERMISIVEKQSLQLGKKISIAIVTDKGYVGCRGASQQWATLLRQNGFAVNELYIDEQYSKDLLEQYSLVLFNGYSGNYNKLIEADVKKVVVWHSSLLQTQLEKEVNQVRRIKNLLDEQKIDTVFCTDRNCLKFFEGASWLPNVYIVEPTFSDKSLVDTEKVNISALGPSKERKNLFTILQAVMHLSDDYRVHINVSDDFYDNNIKGLFDENKIVNHGWLEREDYFSLIKQCNLGVQLSVGESYNFVAADHLVCGTPVICSSSIRAIPSRDLHVANLENSGELIGKIDEVRRANKKKRQDWVTDFQQQNKRHVQKALTLIKKSCDLAYSVPACNIQTRRPILSIVYHGRNDNYAGDFKRRLCWSLSTIQQSFKELQPEILFVCWNTLPLTERLFDDPMFANCRSNVKLYEVSDKIHKEVADRFNYEGVYLEWFAKNFGVRRATGEYILQLNSDNLIVDPVTIDDLPQKDESFVAVRTEVKQEVLTRAPQQLTPKYLNSISRRQWIPDISRPHYVGGSCGEFVLAHRDIWDTIYGNVEVADRYCIDNVTATHLREVSELNIFKHKVYHIEHKSAPGTWPGFEYPIGYSGPDWGLADLVVEPYCYE